MKKLLAVVVALSAVPALADLSPNPKVAATQAALRDLWVGHAFWVRNVSLATMTGNTAMAKASEDEVVANAKAIAAAIEGVYGKPAGDKLFGLLAAHYGAVKAHITATAKGDAKGDAKGVAAAQKQISANLTELAEFLAGANPNLPKSAVEPLLQAHGPHHMTQNEQLKAKKYADEAKTWEAMRGHMEVIADALGDAIAKQFPDKFK